MKSIVIEAENTAPRFNGVFLEYAQSRGFLVDAARVRTPTDKAWVSHCTSWVGSDSY
jgi:transposase